MIIPKEIQKKANVERVRDQQIEKDYILSWILAGISQHVFLSKTLIFKGGTVLKKFYFEDYRFSEDLDFTLTDFEISKIEIIRCFDQTFDFIKEKANIPLEIAGDSEHDDGGFNFYIRYVGPLGGQQSSKKVKVDISRSEILQFNPIIKSCFLQYSDLFEFQILCYSLEEILVEKMRSVMQRMQARDFYDIWYLLNFLNVDVNFFRNEFSNKCQIKGLNPADFAKKIIERLPQYKLRWSASLKDQIKDLPDFEQIERETLRVLKKLNIDNLK